jgi:hypothetical protein
MFPLDTAAPKTPKKSFTASFLALAALTLLRATLLLSLSAPAFAQESFLLVVSRVQYDGNTFGSPETYPYIFTDPTVSGVGVRGAGEQKTGLRNPSSRKPLQ